MALTDSERDRLIALLGMLGSSYEGEVIAAARAACGFVKNKGLTWDDVVKTYVKPAVKQEAPAPARGPTGLRPWNELAHRLLRDFENDLSSIEHQFVTDMSIWHQKPSKKQLGWLERIAKRVTRENT